MVFVGIVPTRVVKPPWSGAVLGSANVDRRGLMNGSSLSGSRIPRDAAAEFPIPGLPASDRGVSDPTRVRARVPGRVARMRRRRG